MHTGSAPRFGCPICRCEATIEPSGTGISACIAHTGDLTRPAAFKTSGTSAISPVYTLAKRKKMEVKYAEIDTLGEFGWDSNLGSGDGICRVESG